MDVPLTPIVVDVVTFDRAPLGRRGYNEDQVDDFLDRVQAALAGEDTLSSHEVRAVEFDPAPFIRRGYHEDQVDEFLDLVVEELDRREGNAPAAAVARPTADSPPGGFPWSRQTPGSGSLPNGAPGPAGLGNHPGTTSLPGGTPGAGNYPGTNTPPGGTPASGGTGGTNTPPGGTPGSNTPPGGIPGYSGNATAVGSTSGVGGAPGPATHGYVRDTAVPGSTSGSTSAPGPAAPGYSGNAPTSGGTAGSTTYPTPGGMPAGTTGHPGNGPAATNPPAGSGGAPSGAGSPGGGSGAGFPDPIAWLPFPPAQPRTVPPLTPAEQTNPMLFAQPPSWPSPSTQPLQREHGDASGPPDSSVAASTDETGGPRATEPDESPVRSQAPSVAAGQAASALRAGAVPADVVEAQEAEPVGTPVRTLADYARKQPPAVEPPEEGPDDEPAFPFPPAPPGEPGYAPADVARLMKLLTTAPDREQLTNMTFGYTTNGGYHTGAVDALRQAWIDALPTKQP